MDDNILIELRKINQQLADIKANTSKTSVAFNSFTSGLFQSLGNFIGMIILTLALVYLFIHFGWDKILLNYTQQLISQSVTKIFSQLLLGRP